jgi:hypothetical protein
MKTTMTLDALIADSAPLAPERLIARARIEAIWKGFHAKVGGAVNSELVASPSDWEFMEALLAAKPVE